ncbi:Ubiquinol-cytochrome-c reductase complex assembly factor 1 [Carex littledalei]|uniref:Ubiquinol-cytochrome-c reductase complex assembly factor 1 n=1 Tax=Carex littledalei TaxID=544730 RepID=A0A833VDQ9_9POAL|nr:Ubiquinol-cytochrome-c reductase complex assembly factor 1 [Carex littledalei]
MLSRLRSAAPHLSSALSSQTNIFFKSTPKETTYYCFLSANAFSSKVAPANVDSSPPTISEKPEVKVDLNAMFWSKPCSLALAKDSPLRIEEPEFSGMKRLMLKLLLFYSKQSKSIRGANIVYKRIISQVDKPPIYDVFNLEKTFKTTYSLLMLHMWLVLRRLKEEGKEGTEFGQYLYEIYNHNLELRVSKAGVNLLLIKWMKDLEKIFYGNIVAYDAALTQEAKHQDLANVLWRNIFSEDGSDSMKEAASISVQAMARYVRRESTCLSLTEKEAIYSGNFSFTPLASSPLTKMVK